MRDAPGLPLRPILGGARTIRTEGIRAGWAALGLLVVAFGVALTMMSARFSYDYDVAEMPIPALVSILVAAGLVYCLALPPLIRAARTADGQTVRLILAGMLLAGLAARLALFSSEPMLEDDYQRYLWDGAVTAAGADPYSVSPHAARTLPPDTTLGRLAIEAGPVVARINHPELTTIYPPVAQLSFALAHVISPWRLTGWRTLVLFSDLATLALILALLRETGRSPLWAALYWWNPLVIKELGNSAHMDALVLPLVLLALLLAARGRRIAASAGLVLAAGAKIWPVLLLPLVLRPLAAKPKMLVAALLICAGLLALLAVPFVRTGLAADSGLAAYVTRWQTSSALFPALQSALGLLLAPFGLGDASAGGAARLVIALLLGCFAGVLSVKPVVDTDVLLGRASILVGALVLLSPAQFPWYAAWIAPFLAFRPWAGFLVLNATAPLYYMSFYLTASGAPELFRHYVVWLIWVPVWIALTSEAMRWRARMT